jgi:hypothetical protein
VEKSVDYLPRFFAQTPFSPLANWQGFLIDKLSPYKSTRISGARKPQKDLLQAEADGWLKGAFHSCP